MIAPQASSYVIGEHSVSSPEPRELPSPVQLGKDFRATVDKDFSTRVLSAEEPITPEQIAAPKAAAPALSVTAPADSQISETTDLIPPPEDHTVPAEPGPSQLPSEEESLQASNSKTNPGVSAPPALTPPIPTSSSPSAVK